MTEAEFKCLDYEVMRFVFAVHNDLGCTCDERIYQNDLGARLQSVGMNRVQREVPITLTHASFRKQLYLDFTVEDRAVYELKAVAALSGGHERQLLTYLLATGATRGKLVNFRPSSVEYRTVNAVLGPEQRRRIDLDIARWSEPDRRSAELRHALTSLLHDWGAFLALSIYEEALIDLLGGTDVVMRWINLNRKGVPLGRQAMCCLNEQVGFKLTAFRRPSENGEEHIRRFLSLTPFTHLHWINFANARIDLVTLDKDGG